jgi:hypothetical protein
VTLDTGEKRRKRMSANQFPSDHLLGGKSVPNEKEDKFGETEFTAYFGAHHPDNYL